MLVLCVAHLYCFVLSRVFQFLSGYSSPSIPYSGKLLREKSFANFAVLWLYAEVFSVQFGGVASFGTAKVSNLQKFSLQKFPAIWY